MMHRLDAQWLLPGASSRYLVVPWFNKAAKDTSRHVSPFSAIRLLDRWLTSRKLVLQEIYESLEGHPPRRLSSFGRAGYSEQLKTRLAEAFRTGTLVVLQEPVSEGETTSPSPGKAPLPVGPIQSKPTSSNGTVMLELEWSEDVIARLPADVSLVLSRKGQQPQTYALSAISRTDGIVRLSLSGLSSTEKLTLIAKKGKQELVLFRDQFVGNPERALVWEHALEELITLEEMSVQEALVKAGRISDDVEPEPDIA